jgi:serine/threonine-protein kinase RsbW
MKTGKVAGIEGMDKFLSEIELATGEACVNSVKHGPEQGIDKIQVSVEFKEKHSNFIVTVSDGNQRYDFSDLEPDFAAVPESGYGIYIMKNLMDKVSYQREKGRNLVIMEKEIKQGEE